MNLVTARATVTPDNSDYKEIFNHLNELEFRAIPIAIAQNMVDDEQFDKILSEYINYIFYFEELILTKQYAKAKKMTELCAKALNIKNDDVLFEIMDAVQEEQCLR